MEGRAAPATGKERGFMHFRVLTDEMNRGMSMVVRALSARPLKQVYDGVFIETADEGLILTCTDGEITIRANVPATVVEDGSALLPARLFGDMMRRQPAGEVDVKVDEKGRAKIKSLGTSSSMAGMDAEDFPDVYDVVSENVVLLPSDRMRDAIGKVMFAVSTDESRKILTGVLMEVYPEETLFVGLDGFRLALQRIARHNDLPARNPNRIACVTPGRIMNEVAKMLPDDPDVEVKVTFTESHIMVSFDSIRVYATLLTGEFIDYQKILPKSWTTEVAVERTLFSHAIERCSLMAREGKNNLIYLNMKKDAQLEMTANAERGDVHEVLDIGFEGNELEIAFNSRYLQDVIHNISGDRICMCFNSNVSPCMIKPPEGKDYVFLVLPVRIFGR